MAYYDIIDNSNGNIVASNVWIDEDGQGASVDAMTISAVLLYLFGFIGMGIMLFNLLPTPFVFVGIIAALIYALPLIMVVLALILRPFVYNKDDDFFNEEDEPITHYLCGLLLNGGSIVKNVLKNFISPFAFCLFNVFIALFWICYPLGTIKEATLIGIIIPCAYSMYYYPFVLIKNARKRHSKLLGLSTVGIILLSLAVFLLNYDRFMQTDSVVGIALFFSMITVFGTFAI
ncbi:MAG: hypothetical protein J6Q68_00950, partial [Clostridia bacterium]|nr:hypothetical protein [Clostridia bacterium]